MPDSGRLIVVSNRLPVSLVREGTDWKTERSTGGLATAMDPILKRSGGVWMGWSGIKEEAPPKVPESLRREQACIAVHIPAEVVEKFYEGYANQALWPLFHSFTSRLRFDPESWEAYIEANERFCSAVVDEFRPGDRIWVHDYHLMLLPGMLRERIPDAAIGFFLHIPFPASDIVSTLPRSDELMAGLLGADLISFHTHTYLQHFRQSLRRLLDIESTVDRLEVRGREVRLQALPIGIAPDDFLEHIEQPETKEQLENLRAQYSGRKVIVAVDRLDYTKGLPERLRTFRRLAAYRPRPHRQGCSAADRRPVARKHRELSGTTQRSPRTDRRNQRRIRNTRLGTGGVCSPGHLPLRTRGGLSLCRYSVGFAFARRHESGSQGIRRLPPGGPWHAGAERVCGQRRRNGRSFADQSIR